MKKVPSILLVDDNRFDLILTKKMLEKSGCFEHIFEVTDGSEALDLFRNYEESCRKYPGRFPPLVILLDINMPLMNGFEFLEAFSSLETGELGGTSIVVMLTSSSYENDRSRALEFPIVKDYIVKPMSRERARELAETLGV